MRSWGKYGPRSPAESAENYFLTSGGNKRPRETTGKGRISAPGQAITATPGTATPDPITPESSPWIHGDPPGDLRRAHAVLISGTTPHRPPGPARRFPAARTSSATSRHPFTSRTDRRAPGRPPGHDTRPTRPGKTHLQGERTAAPGYTSGLPYPGRCPLIPHPRALGDVGKTKKKSGTHKGSNEEVLINTDE
ncbi:hypothetical protein ES703_63067 [subsurface metagenome]